MLKDTEFSATRNVICWRMSWIHCVCIQRRRIVLLGVLKMYQKYQCPRWRRARSHSKRLELPDE
jgi:hypothetical protein